MKWNKFDSKNPPKFTPGKSTFWLIKWSSGVYFTAGSYLGDEGLCIHAGDKGNIELILSPNRLMASDAHWIYSQDIEMP